MLDSIFKLYAYHLQNGLQICGASPQWNLRNLGTNPSGYYHGLSGTLLVSPSNKGAIDTPNLAESKSHGKCTPTGTQARLVVKSHKIGNKIFTPPDKEVIEHGFVGLIRRGDKETSIVSICIKSDQKARSRKAG